MKFIWVKRPCRIKASMSTSSYPLLYTFRRCPYAMRARMALSVSEQTCEVRELVLREKPQHMLEISPKGTVPVLQTRTGDVLEESLDVMLWALQQNDPEGWLAPELGDKTVMLELIERCDEEFKPHLDRYKYANRYEDADPGQQRKLAETFIHELNERLEDRPYLFGNEASLADYAIAPFIRQFANTDRSWFDQTPYPNLHRWLDAFLQSALFNSIMEKRPPWKPGDEVTYRF